MTSIENGKQPSLRDLDLLNMVKVLLVLGVGKGLFGVSIGCVITSFVEMMNMTLLHISLGGMGGHPTKSDTRMRTPGYSNLFP